MSTIFWIFSNIDKNIELDVLSKTSAENRIVKNWKTSHRQKIASLRKLNNAHPYPSHTHTQTHIITIRWLSASFPGLVSVFMYASCVWHKHTLSVTTSLIRSSIIYTFPWSITDFGIWHFYKYTFIHSPMHWLRFVFAIKSPKARLDSTRHLNSNIDF